MNTSTQAMNNVSKVQTPATINKSQQGKQETELNFTELFSSALGQSAPKAQLNSIETQLRESLYQQNKQDKPKKNNDSNAEAAQAAQAAVWAQRNWMQTAPVQQTTAQPPNASSAEFNNTEPATQTATPENMAEKNKPETTKVAASNTTSKTTESNQENSDRVENATAQTTAQNTEQASKAELPGNTTNTANGTTTENTAAELQLNSASTKGAGDQTTNPPQSGNEQGAANLQAADDKTHPDIKTTAQLKAEATLTNNPAAVRAELSPGNGSASAGTQTTTQLAPQIASQIAQQAQALGVGLDDSIAEDGLKVGQKILAGSSLQSSSMATGISAGTNGLTGSASSTQQALIKTPVNQPGFAKEIGQTVQWAIGKNLSTVDIRVNPESFGPMNMRLVQKGQQVQLMIRTQDEASANLLNQALGGLKEVLAQNGLQLNQVQIQHGNTQAQQSQTSNGQAQFEQNRNQNQGQGSGQHSTGGNKSQNEPVATAASATARKPEGKLDLFA